MIKIDGEKIKQLRESQGLTQLYMATAVEVTTDTISRWENKRYPTIKEENAEKLAETLGVTVAEILLVEEDDAQESEPSDNKQENTGVPPATLKRSPFHMAAFLAILALIILISIYFGGKLFENNPAPVTSAVRIMPPRAIPGSTFPIVIEVSQSSDKPVSIILKEMLPSGCEVVQVSPSTGSSSVDQEIKWLYKLEETTRFSYLAKINAQTGTEHTFEGTVTTARTDESIAVSGKSSIEIGRYHWADLDGDGAISDQEILTVFDYYSGIDDIAIDIELIEKMWLGSGYTWNRDKDLITISP